MSKDLFVIEAPGKIAALRKVLDKIGYSGSSIYATRGRLYDLSKATLGLDLDNLEKIQLSPISQPLLDRLVSKIESADRIFVMTDSDHEGDLIASHVKGLIPYYKESFRVISSSITASSIKKALEEPIDFREDRARGSLSRRIFDRICGFHFSKNIGNGRVAIGRVLSPVLQAIANSKQRPEAYLEKNIQVKDGYLTVRVNVQSCDPVKFESLKRYVQNITVESIRTGIPVSRKIESAPFTGPEALVKLSRATGGSINDVSDSLQKLYEKGFISYHRTDSKSLTKNAVSKIAEVCSKAGEHTFDIALLDKHIDNSSKDHAHEGIHVTELSDSINARYEDLSLEDKVYRLVYRNSLSMGKNVVCYESEVAVESRAIDLLREEGCHVETTFGCIKDNMYRNTSPLSDFPGLCPELVQGVAYYPRASDRVAEVMLDLGVGRPSTFAYHCDKIANDYLDSNGDISFRGYASIQRAIEVAPLVMSPERSIDIERMLINAESIETSVYNSFYEAGIKDEFMFGKMKSGARTKTVDHNISYNFE